MSTKIADLNPKVRAMVHAALNGGKPIGLARADAVGRVQIEIASEASNENPPRRPLPHPQPERHEAPALDRAVPREAEGIPRAVVRFTGYRVRPLDPDNFAGSCKDLLDGLRHAQLIRGDEPWRIKLVTGQVRVATMKEERTEIDLEVD